MRSRVRQVASNTFIKMKELIKKINRFKVVATILNNNSAVFEGFPEIMDARDTFLSKKDSITSLFSSLSKPYTEFHGVKTDSRIKLRSSLNLAIGTGITIASRQKNVPMLQTLKKYRSSLSRATIINLPEMAARVFDELKQYETLAIASGLTAEKLLALKDYTSNFREIVETTDYEISTRKTARVELRLLVRECTQILKDELGPFVDHCKDTSPEFYKAYATVQAPKRRKKRKAAGESLLCDISGTVTNSVTNEPVPDATILIDGSDTNYTTDEDGYYLAEDIAGGYHKITCFSTGFNNPQPMQDTLSEGESLVVDFSLVPLNPLNN